MTRERLLTEVSSLLLDRQEAEAVLGDLMEAGEPTWKVVLGMTGLAARRQLVLWRSWRPWLAAFGLALPGSFLLMGLSLSVSESISTNPSLPLLISRLALLIAWSWAGGFVVGSISRPTLRLSIACCFAPCLFCLARFRESPLPSLCLLLFLLPAVAGVHSGLRRSQIDLRLATALALIGTLLMIPEWHGTLLTLNWVLVWPAWYLVATSRRTA